jgi:Zn-dependent protease with chaperone function
VPIELLTLTVLTIAMTPLRNAISRRMEAEADWRALSATHDPAAARELLRRLAVRSLGDPDPPICWRPTIRASWSGSRWRTPGKAGSDRVVVQD